MNHRINYFFVLILLTSSIAAIYFFYINVKERNSLTQKFNKSQGKIDYLLFQQSYADNLIAISQIENNRSHDFSTVNFSTRLLGQPETVSSRLSEIIIGNKPKLVVRYTEIGCNSCADSTFKIIQHNSALLNKYDVIVLVDFSSDDAYLKWRKLNPVSYPIYWVKKGDLPFKADKGGDSYIFCIKNKTEVFSFFIPNSKFPEYIHHYFENL